MTTKISAGPVQPIVSQVAPYLVRGGVATPVYVYTSLPAGRAQVAGKALPVRFITSSDLVENGGVYRLAAATSAMPVIAVSGVTYGASAGPALPVYDVTNLNYPPSVIIPPPPSGFTLPTLPSTSYLLALFASQMSLGAVTTASDFSGLHHDFARGAGSSALNVQSIGGYNTVVFNSTDDWMLGPNFADNLASMAIFAVFSATPGQNVGALINKLNYNNTSAGWTIFPLGGTSALQWNDFNDNTNSDAILTDGSPLSAYHVVDYQKPSNLTATINIDGVAPGQTFACNGAACPVTSFGNSENVVLGADESDNVGAGHYAMNLRSLVICSPAPSAPDAATLRSFLAAQGGVML